METVPVVLCGGSGKRLWPLSSSSLPKPFLKLPDGKTLMERTYRRIAELPGIERVLTVTNRRYASRCRQEWERAGAPFENRFLLEREGKDTAFAVLVATLAMRERQKENVVMLVLPADHLIRDHVAFVRDVETAKTAALEGRMVTFGLPTLEASTAFGYVMAEEKLSENLFRVGRFVEKPKPEIAELHHENPAFFWNSGIFCATRETLLTEFKTRAPELYERTLENWRSARPTEAGFLLDGAKLDGVTPVSFDYAVMEKTKGAAMVKSSFDWKDVGTWDAYGSEDSVAEDQHGNRLLCDGGFFAKNASDNLVIVEAKGRNVALIGVKDLIVVESSNGLLVCQKNDLQNVKEAADFMIPKPNETTDEKEMG